MVPDTDKPTPIAGCRLVCIQLTRSPNNQIDGSPRRGKTRTSITFTVFADLRRMPKQGDGQRAYYFEGATAQSPISKAVPPARTPRTYRNPIALSREWQCLLEARECATRADLARKAGVSRARVSQILGLLTLSPEVIQATAALGDPMRSPIVTERALRRLLGMAHEVQISELHQLIDGSGSGRNSRLNTLLPV